MAGLLAGLAAGCGAAEPDGYEPELRYPPRADVVVVRPPADQPAGPSPPGRLDEFLAGTTARGGVCVPPEAASDSDRAVLAETLERLFGTPAAPTLPGGPAVGGFELSPATLAAGSVVYSRKCVSCHGLTGSGRGPTAPWTEPHPRDFRAGAFKSGVGGAKPSAERMAHLLRRGVPGTPMPAFDLLPPADLAAVSAYVVHLSARGEAEAAGLLAAADGEDVVAAVGQAVGKAVEVWGRPAEPLPEMMATDDPEALRRGLLVFHSPVAGCTTCHQDYGRAETYRYDCWGAPARVRDLTRNEFRWGDDPATLAGRVRHGIPAAGMPANPHLTPGQLSDLVAFVRDVGQPGRLPADVRDRVSPQAVR